MPSRRSSIRLRAAHVRFAALGVCLFAGAALVLLASSGISQEPGQEKENGGEVAGDQTLPATTVARPREQEEDLTQAFRVPEGFRVERFAGDELAHDLFAMTVDPHGNVVVAGPGYIRTLYDDDGDGQADRGLDYAKTKGGAHGLAFDGPNLYATADDALLYFEDADGDGVADGKPKRILELKSPEHGANGLAWGSDGWLYGVTGNDAGDTSKINTVLNPLVPEPNCGVVWRLDPESGKSEVVAHGFRNPYDLAFLPSGELMTVDSDGERDQYLPWYAPTRLFDVQLGGHHGWIQSGWQQSWNRPAYYFDVVDRVAEIGRGSPTGVQTYWGRSFPRRYQGNVFSACWTLGRIYFFDLQRSGSSFVSTPEVFLETRGTVGFAPVDLAEGKDGSLFVAVGGRGTQGSVFRVKYEGEGEDDQTAQAAGQKEQRIESENGGRPSAPQYRRELEAALARGQGLPRALYGGVTSLDDPRTELIVSLFSRGVPIAVEPSEFARALATARSRPDRRKFDNLRNVQIALGDWSVEPKGPAVYAGYELTRDVPDWFPDLLARWPIRTESSEAPGYYFHAALAEWLRLAGAVNLTYDQAAPVIDLWFAREDLSPQDEIHALICISRMPGERTNEAAERIAAVLAALPHRMRELGQQPSRNFPDRMREVVTELLKRDEALAERLVARERFGAPMHADWVGLLPESLRAKAAERIASVTDPEEWTSETVELFAYLDEERRRELTDEAWNYPALREATLRRLAADARDQDLARLLIGLDSPNASTVQLVAETLRSLGVDGTPLEQTAVVRALRQQLRDERAVEARQALANLLAEWSEGLPTIEEGRGNDRKEGPANERYASLIAAWEAAHPDLIAAAMSAADDVPAWLERLPEIEGLEGDAEKGKVVFETRQCARCHASASKVGPDLKGAAQRFNAKDLLVAIVDPSREVSPTYQTTRLLTRSGKSYVGMVVYESPEGTLLQTDAETTIRIAGEELAAFDKVRQSLMPTGLLRDVSSQEVADLLAYLGTLK
ncbi:MAG TPA: PVC-type heme-binding CxxCH protein [Pirellulaceae bacterium]|jgi:putative membrane-bound dehydrogenase-like protein|nr:PVC-type heme-binding CxxCH protein [Pirellulaceae bacterium]